MARIKKEIVEALLTNTKKSRPTVYRMIEKIRINLLLPDDSTGRNAAANFLASQFVDITKYGLTNEELNEIRDLRKISTPVVSDISKKNEKRVKESTVIIRFDEKLVELFNLPNKIAKEAKMMAEIYPLVYLLENLLRNNIIHILSKKYNDEWWDKCNISKDTRENVEDRIRFEKTNRWHSKRGSHPIYYTDFNDLRSIIINNWQEFKPIFPDQIWIQSRLKDIEPSRNIIAHNNPLSKREIKRIKMIVDDFKDQLRFPTL